MKNDLKSMSLEELKIFLSNLGEPSFRAKQIFDWIQNKNVDDLDFFNNIPKTLRMKLKEVSSISYVKQLKKLESKDDSTIKYLFEVENNNIIESVLMKYSYGNAVCISTQVGCKMGCSFCASTLEGVERNLTAGEMLSQIFEIQKDIGEKIHSVVLMGSGEPLDNYDNVLKFIYLANDNKGLNLGQRHITLSTCGIVDKIYSLADEELQITLAVSLHAPNDNIRNTIMPISKKYSMNELLKACSFYTQKTKRRITFEYALIDGVNDSVECAIELAKKLKNTLSHVNLIPINDVKEKNYKRSDDKTIIRFSEILLSRGVKTTIRRKLGSDINAACGQLRKGYIDKKHSN